MAPIAPPGDSMPCSSRPKSLDDDGNLTKKFQHPAAARASKRANTLGSMPINTEGYESSADDSNFQTRESTESETDGGSGEISNAELAATLVSKIIPEGDRLTSVSGRRS
ncbi:hypothetical protein M378DRAFT_28414 [Amanita muscaria Koide BX008]|uniref:Uncharacterized protein n=1 Tax=Amanita muscaria (strain Koide BX008) TaxID=946122 RepID=A0A0C2W4P1_AMAMK|nr:hypothetical protein M378DRAFT_28414 [Amanita muscaria Koide BX008]